MSRVHACPACGYSAQLSLGLPPTRGNTKAALRSLLKSARPQGLTVEEMCKALHRGHQQVSPRVLEMERAGELKCIDARATSHGVPARVWTLSAVEGLER